MYTETRKQRVFGQVIIEDAWVQHGWTQIGQQITLLYQSHSH